MKIAVDERGYYGNFGGAYIPEMLYPNVEELRQNYLSIMNDKRFKKDFKHLLKTYVGRPTPLYLAKRLSKKYHAKIYLKREDLCHTGAHKVNNTIGQILLAKKLKKHKIIAETGAGQHGVATALFVRSWAWNASCIWVRSTWKGKSQMSSACGY